MGTLRQRCRQVSKRSERGIPKRRGKAEASSGNEAGREKARVDGPTAGHVTSVSTLAYLAWLAKHIIALLLYSADRDEPPHVHVEREEGQAKFWLEPVRLEKSRDFGRVEIGRIQGLVEEDSAFLLRSWHEYFGD